MQQESTLGATLAGERITLERTENHLVLLGPHGGDKGSVMLRAAQQAAASGIEVLVVDLSRFGPLLEKAPSTVHVDTVAGAAELLRTLQLELFERLLHRRRGPWALLLIHGLQELDAGLDLAHHRILLQVLLRAEAAGLRIISTTTSTGGRVRKILRQAVHGGAAPAVLVLGEAPHFVLSVARRDSALPEVEHSAECGRGTLISPRLGSELSLQFPPLAP